MRAMTQPHPRTENDSCKQHTVVRVRLLFYTYRLDAEHHLRVLYMLLQPRSFFPIIQLYSYNATTWRRTLPAIMIGTAIRGDMQPWRISRRAIAFHPGKPGHIRESDTSTVPMDCRLGNLSQWMYSKSLVHLPCWLLPCGQSDSVSWWLDLKKWLSKYEEKSKSRRYSCDLLSSSPYSLLHK